MGHSSPGSLADMTGPIGEVTNLVTLLAGATFGATKLWKGWLSPWLQDPQAPPKKSPLEELASGLQEVLGGLSALQGAVEGLRDRLDRQQENLQKQQELLQVMQLEDGGVKEIKQEIQSIKAIVIGRLAKPLDGKGEEEDTIEDHDEEDHHKMADDMREADETDDDEEPTEREDNHNDSESWEGLSAENEEEEESLNQDEVVNEQEEKEKENLKEPVVQPRVPELIFQDGQWVQSSDA